MSDQLQGEENAAQEIDINKTRLIKSSILSGIIIVLFGLLFLFIFLSRSSWNNGLKDKIQKVLSEKSDNGVELFVDEMDEINSGASSIVVSYSLVGSNNKASQFHAILVRMNTLYGPMASIFLYDAVTEETRFFDFADFDSIARDSIIPALQCSQIPYWENRIPKIMKASRSVSADFKGGL